MSVGALAVVIAAFGMTEPDIKATLYPVEVTGKDVTFTMKLENLGTVAKPFSVGVYHNLSGEPAPGQAPDYTFQLDQGIASFGSWIGKYTVENVSDGFYQAWIQVDPSGVLGDQDLSNNVDGPATYSVPSGAGGELPDLAITDIQWHQTAIELVYQVTLKNGGSTVAKDFGIDIFYNATALPDCWSDDVQNMPGSSTPIGELGSGESLTVTFYWPYPPAGDHTSWVKLDCWQVVPEGNESNNNSGAISVAFKEGMQGVDLELVELSAKSDCSSVSYTVELENSGDMDAPPFKVGFYYDLDNAPMPSDEPDFVAESAALPAGSKIQVTHNHDAAIVGKTLSWVVVDPDGQVSETAFNENGVNVGEENNVASVDVEVSLDVAGCECVNKVAIDLPCVCGGELVPGGFCCDGQWQDQSCVSPPGAPPTETETEPAPEPDGGDGESPRGPGGESGTSDSYAFGAPPGGWNGENPNNGPNVVYVDQELEKGKAACSAAPVGSTTTLALLLLVLALLLGGAALAPLRRY